MSEAEPIRDLSLIDEMKTSYVDYAMSVIVSRALPDVRDGLKPSQRRILYAMNSLGLVPGGSTRKCANISGETSGNYHPHGDQVVYPTLVRLGQEWSMRYLLVAKRGNFGSQDGDPPAAQRYTEAKMAPAALDLMGEELDQDTVPYVPNYDGRLTEPTVLPSKFPNLLCNGADGIAVGMATKIPPHNLGEVCDAIIAVLDDPDLAPAQLLKHIKGPDFPTGGIIIGTKGIRQAYIGTGNPDEKGRGLVTVRARCEIEEKKGGKSTIVVTELPYQVTRSSVVEKVRDLIRSDRVKGISDVNDMSDKTNPLRIEIDLKKEANARVVLNQLYKYTPLQDTYGINMIALLPVERDLHDLEPYNFEDYEPTRPQRLNLKELIEQYRDHRYVVVRRRTNFLLQKARARLHIVEGRLKALDHIDKIIRLIRESHSTDDARSALMSEYDFSEIQADDILAMPLRQLTGLARENLEKELEQLQADIARFEEILGNPTEVIQIIRGEVEALKKKYGDARRTEIDTTGDADMDDPAAFVADEEVIVTISHEGYVKRVPLNTYRRQGRAGVGVSSGDLKEGDFVEHLFTTSTHHYILVFTDRGKLFWLRVWDLPEMSRTARGRSIRNFLQLDSEERISAAYQAKDFDEGFIVMATRNGVIKKTALKEYGNVRANGIIAIRLDEGDSLIGVRMTRGDEDLILGTAKGYAIRFPSDDKELALPDEETGEKVTRKLTGVRAMGRVTRGVRGIKLRDGDEVVDLIIARDGIGILTVCARGYGKRTPLDDYRLQSRGGMGIINIKATKRNGDVVALKDVWDHDELMLMSEKGQMVRFEITGESMREMGRATQGVRLKKLAESDRIVAVTRIPKDIASKNGDEDGGEEDDGESEPDGGAPAKARRRKKTDADGDDVDNLDARLKAFDDKHGKKLEDFEKRMSKRRGKVDEDDEPDEDEDE